ncbi:toll-like receptor 2 type-2 isoform X1 [Patella vulgata]|uniref:toll-like receptor 2 type-2 isoform X1 n=1 Tax=Patella vulgata TaxID=6465 RepID=UPI0024A883E2|nr:toll-like receptor 2 type-2 isoform X1 [Patella vulgata]
MVLKTASFVFGLVLVCGYIVVGTPLPLNDTADNPVADVNNENIQVSNTSENIDISILGDNLCDIVSKNQNYSVICNVDNNGVFEFTTFRDWSKLMPNSSTISLSVTCVAGGVIKLPWPFLSLNLEYLSVSGCRVQEFFSEMFDFETIKSIPVKLSHVEIVDTNIEIDFVDTMQISLNFSDISPEYECGPINVRTYIWRNVTMSIVGEMPLPDYSYHYDDSLETARQQAVRANNDPTHTCNYKATETYEQSNTNGISPFELSMLVGNSYFPNLKLLNYTNTGYKDIPNELVDWRKEFPKLEKLDLSHNDLSRFHFKDVGYGTTPTGYINLQYNNIQSLSETEIESLSLLESALIDIRNNPFKCECNEITYFNQFLLQNDGPVAAGLRADYEYLWDIKCVQPPRLAGRKISELNKSILCDADVSIYVAQIATLSTVVIILLIIIVLITRYRKDIRIIFFTRLNIILPCQPKEDNAHKKFDAFISYSSADTEWVLKTLAPGLEVEESGFNFKLCLHHRDFEVGSYICDNIISSVENSRHTVLVISKHFLESEWCVMEFRTALRQSLLEKSQHMVIILLEDVTLTDIEADFRRCLQTMTYIKTDDILFWDRIRYALAKKSRPLKTTPICLKEESQ